MIHRHIHHKHLVWVMGALSILFLFGCAVQKPLWGDPESGLILTYRMVEGKALQYQRTGKIISNLEIMGQAMTTSSEVNMGFSAALKGMKEENLVLEITVGKLDINTIGLQGSASPETGSISGKGFDLTLSPTGEELELAGAKALTYETGPSATSSVKSLFDRSLPNLPAQPVKMGDTWTSTDDITNDDSNTKTHTVMTIDSVLAGFETVDGMECAKITSKLSGTTEGDGSQMGADFTFEGKLKGTSTAYFAYKEGVLVSTKLALSGEATVNSAMGVILMTTKNTEEIKLLQP